MYVLLARSTSITMRIKNRFQIGYDTLRNTVDQVFLYKYHPDILRVGVGGGD